MLRNPEIEKSLKIAKMNKTPEEFFRQVLALTIITAFFLEFVTILLLTGLGKGNIALFILSFIAYLGISYQYFKRTPQVYIRKRQRDIEKEVLFAGRYLLVKIESGMPLINSLEDASHSYGVSSKYFKEIVDDIKTGMPIEESLEKAREMSPSKYFKMILSELLTSLKTGVDISAPLRSILRQITREQMLEIKDYAKKLNAFIMVYMVLAAVLPSLGMTIFIIIAAFMGMDFSTTMMVSILLFFAFMQYIFIAVLQSIRPLVNM